MVRGPSTLQSYFRLLRSILRNSISVDLANERVRNKFPFFVARDAVASAWHGLTTQSVFPQWGSYFESVLKHRDGTGRQLEENPTRH